MRQRRYADTANTWNVMVENARPIVGSLGPAVERHQDLQAHHGLDSTELIRYGLLPKGRPRKVSKKQKEEAAAKAKSVEAGKVDVEVAPA